MRSSQRLTHWHEMFCARAGEAGGIRSNMRLKVGSVCTLDLHVRVERAAADAEGESGGNFLGFLVGKCT
jgi:hypothetical protein